MKHKIYILGAGESEGYWPTEKTKEQAFGQGMLFAEQMETNFDVIITSPEILCISTLYEFLKGICYEEMCYEKINIDTDRRLGGLHLNPSFNHEKLTKIEKKAKIAGMSVEEYFLKDKDYIIEVKDQGFNALEVIQEKLKVATRNQTILICTNCRTVIEPMIMAALSVSDWSTPPFLAVKNGLVILDNVDGSWNAYNRGILEESPCDV